MNARTPFIVEALDNLPHMLEQRLALEALVDKSEYFANAREVFQIFTDRFRLDYKRVFTPEIELSAPPSADPVRLIDTFSVQVKGRKVVDTFTLQIGTDGETEFFQAWEFTRGKINNREQNPVAKLENAMSRWVSRMDVQHRWSGIKLGKRLAAQASARPA